ncbi:hypothetical protein BKA69DRAFT_118340 [Paraphysoderma sedebokerense]|nr:hypothetical protein BKA69DRAFT_118340 [Paraphysoderma sedebokerense]
MTTSDLISNDPNLSSDDDAPEAISLSTGKQSALSAKLVEKEVQRKLKEEQKRKRRHKDEVLKSQKSQKKARTVSSDSVETPNSTVKEQEDLNADNQNEDNGNKDLEMLPQDLLNSVAQMEEEMDDEEADESDEEKEGFKIDVNKKSSNIRHFDSDDESDFDDISNHQDEASIDRLSFFHHPPLLLPYHGLHLYRLRHIQLNSYTNNYTIHE